MSNAYRGVVSLDNGKVLLAHWKFEKQGAILDLYLYWYEGTGKFCIEGKLSYGRVVDIAKGDVCAVQDESGDFNLSANAECEIGGKRVAKSDAKMKFYIDWNTGDLTLKAYDIEVCGSNTVRLKCKVWKDGYLHGNNDFKFGLISNDVIEQLGLYLSDPLLVTSNSPYEKIDPEVKESREALRAGLEKAKREGDQEAINNYNYLLVTVNWSYISPEAADMMVQAVNNGNWEEAKEIARENS